jgi:cytochrome c2
MDGERRRILRFLGNGSRRRGWTKSTWQRCSSRKKKCALCHVVEDRGGNTGPELTYYGDKNPELLNFAHVSGARTMFNWNIQHLTNAGIVSPGTQMPDFNFPPERLARSHCS